MHCVFYTFFRTGDADLYASQIISKPTYEPDHYCLQSTTCGEDTIFIPKRYLLYIIILSLFYYSQYVTFSQL